MLKCYATEPPGPYINTHSSIDRTGESVPSIVV